MAVIGFKERITDLAGSLGTADDNALQQWIVDGCYDVISKVRGSGAIEASEFAKQSSAYTSSMTVALDSIRDIISVERDGISCQKIPFSKAKYADPNTTLGAMSIHKATSLSPVFYKHDNQLIVKPNPTVTEQGYYSYIPEYSLTGWTSTSADIDNFPKQYYEHVILYAAIATLDRQLLDMLSNSEIVTSFTAINTEIDECLTVADNMHTEIGDALAEIQEAITLTDTSSSTILTAITNMNSAIDKFRESGNAPVLFGDSDTYTSGLGMPQIKDALDKAKTLLTDDASYNALTGVTDNVTNVRALYWLGEEDTEMLSGALSLIDAELKRANVHLAEWNAAVNTLNAEIQGFASEASTTYGWVSTKAQVWGGELSAAQAYGAEIQSKLGIAQSYASEAKIRMERDNQKYQWQQERRDNLKREYLSKFPQTGNKGGQ